MEFEKWLEIERDCKNLTDRQSAILLRGLLSHIEVYGNDEIKIRLGNLVDGVKKIEG